MLINLFGSTGNYHETVSNPFINIKEIIDIEEKRRKKEKEKQ